jgi:uncharacterized protein (TIGR01244 family)
VTPTRQLDEKTLVSGQISPADVAEFQRQGVTMIVNNRPDHEDEGQPLSGEIEEAAELAGVEFRFIPIVRGIGPADVDAMHHAMRDCGDGKLLAFCRSGTRSTLAWAVARARQGVPREILEAGAAEAGVDLNPIVHLL